MRILCGTLLLLVLSACGVPASEGTDGSATGSITVGEPWVRAALLIGDSNRPSDPAQGSTMDEHDMSASDGMEMDGAVSAGYMTLRNVGTEADRLLEVSSDIAGEVQMHTSESKDNVMSMRQVEAIDVPAGGTTTLEPGGYHLMILDLKRDLKAGEMVRLTLRFEQAGTVEVDAAVREAGG